MIYYILLVSAILAWTAQSAICDTNEYVSESGFCMSCPSGSTRDAGDDTTDGPTQCAAIRCAALSVSLSNGAIPESDTVATWPFSLPCTDGIVLVATTNSRVDTNNDDDTNKQYVTTCQIGCDQQNGYNYVDSAMGPSSIEFNCDDDSVDGAQPTLYVNGAAQTEDQWDSVLNGLCVAEDDGGDFPISIIIIIAAVLVVGVIIAIVLCRRKGEDDNGGAAST